MSTELCCGIPSENDLFGRYYSARLPIKHYAGNSIEAFVEKATVENSPAGKKITTVETAKKIRFKNAIFEALF
ncbi:hypothetical protein [Salinimicrobium oceani]|uniref:Uncharacterized protein n=1 Tax=Salinimicrobium oceani TaxID=2722702 RepID=A0ABX1CUW0_9FLAO|nr:hypothetical protein [Salinimicrobium oceani]NJW52086.1 hypothetical protein [Salinimicrobium oceani]